MHIPARSLPTHRPGHRRHPMLLGLVIFAGLLCWVLSEVQSGCGCGCVSTTPSSGICLPAPHVQSIREATCFCIWKSHLF